MQAEQVEDEVAPVTAEYFPAKASNEEYAYFDSDTSVEMNTRKNKPKRWGREHVSK
jgi:hypothetical protein